MRFSPVAILQSYYKEMKELEKTEKKLVIVVHVTVHESEKGKTEAHILFGY